MIRASSNNSVLASTRRTNATSARLTRGMVFLFPDRQLQKVVFMRHHPEVSRALALLPAGRGGGHTPQHFVGHRRRV